MLIVKITKSFDVIGSGLAGISAASYLAMSGATLSEIAAVLGHKTLSMVKRYSHITDQHTSNVVKKMNRQIFE